MRAQYRPICSLFKSFTASLKSDYQYIKNICKSIIKIISSICSWHLLTLVFCHFVTLISINAAPILSTSGKKTGRKLVRAFLLKLYIIVCYFTLIIFSTVELTLFTTRFVRHKLCLLLFWFQAWYFVVQVFADISGFSLFWYFTHRQSKLALENAEFPQPVLVGHF